MAEIIPLDTTWDLQINMNANPVETIDKLATEGYKATIGLDPATEKHVVMEVFYDKNKYTLNDVANKLEKLRTCGKCSTLDKEKMGLEKISLGSISTGNGEMIDESGVADPVTLQNVHKLPTQPAQPQRVDIKNLFTDALFDAMFTKTGLYFLGSLTGDTNMMDKVMPKTPEEMENMMDEMVDFLSGETELFRSPDQAKEYLSMIRASRENDTKAVKKIGYNRKNRRVESPGVIIC